MVQIYGNKFITPVNNRRLMVPEEKLWNPIIKKAEQCNVCRHFFHQQIGGICDPCYVQLKNWEYTYLPSHFVNPQGEEE